LLAREQEDRNDEQGEPDGAEGGLMDCDEREGKQHQHEGEPANSVCAAEGDHRPDDPHGQTETSNNRER
jgi:hypothetical protein